MSHPKFSLIDLICSCLVLFTLINARYLMFPSWLSPNLVSRNLYTNIGRTSAENNNWLRLQFSMFARWSRPGLGLHCKPYSPWPYLLDKKQKFKQILWQGSKSTVVDVKYRILTEYLHGALTNFLRGILAFHKNDTRLLAIYIS